MCWLLSSRLQLEEQTVQSYSELFVWIWINRFSVLHSSLKPSMYCRIIEMWIMFISFSMIENRSNVLNLCFWVVINSAWSVYSNYSENNFLFIFPNTWEHPNLWECRGDWQSWMWLWWRWRSWSRCRWRSRRTAFPLSHSQTPPSPTIFILIFVSFYKIVTF